MGTAICPICYSEDNIYLFDVRIKRHLALYNRTMPFRVVIRLCRYCLNAFQDFNHNKDSIRGYYARSEYRGIPRIRWEWYVRKSLPANELITKSGLRLGSRILDIGCADGLVCKYLHEKGYDVYGIDPDSEMTEYVKKELKLENIRCGYYNLDSFPENMFDAIIMQHTLEHFWDIENVMMALNKHLRIGGVIRVQTPCLDVRSKEEVFHGDHLVGFSSRGIVNLFSSLGFSILETWTSRICDCPGDGGKAAGEGAVSLLARLEQKVDTYKVKNAYNEEYINRILRRNETMRNIEFYFYRLVLAKIKRPVSCPK